MHFQFDENKNLVKMDQFGLTTIIRSVGGLLAEHEQSISLKYVVEHSNIFSLTLSVSIKLQGVSAVTTSQLCPRIMDQ